MDDARVWSLPRSKDVTAIFRHDALQLTQVLGQDDVPVDPTIAQKMLSLWKAGQALQDAALMAVRSADGVALAMRNGGFIVIGTPSLNIGLLRAAAKKFPTVTTGSDPAWTIDTSDRFRKVFWEIVTRLDTTVLPRCFDLDIAGVRGQIAAENGTLRFAGDFTTPEAFVAELRAASKIDDDIRYTLTAKQPKSLSDPYSTADLLAQVATLSSDDSFTFDADGWPLTCPAGAAFGFVRTLSAIAAGFAACEGPDATLSILSDANLPLVTARRGENGAVTLKNGRMP